MLQAGMMVIHIYITSVRLTHSYATGVRLTHIYITSVRLILFQLEIWEGMSPPLLPRISA